MTLFRPPPSPKTPDYRLDNSKIYEVTFRVPAWMKQDLVLYCENHDIPVARVLRKLVRELLSKGKAVE